jgi:homopolymeric O-antigen transport system permease protein
MATTAPHRPTAHVTVLQPAAGWPLPRLRDVWDRRELLYYFFTRDVKVRYAQTLLGAFWAFFQPIAMMLVFTFAFRQLGRVQTENVAYPVYAFAGLTFWTFFSRAVLSGADSVASNAAILTKTALPRVLLPIAAVASALFDFVVTFVLLIGFVAFYGYHPTWRLALVLVCMAFGIALALGMSLILSAVNVRYRDVRNVLPMFIQFLLFASPVVYSLTTLGPTWNRLLSINPVVGLVQGFRWCIVGTGPPSHLAIETSVVGTVLILAVGLVYFGRFERVFADVA